MRFKYWKVHKSDIDKFKEFGANNTQIVTWLESCDKYRNHIYICECNYENLKYSYMPYLKSSIEYFKIHDFVYMGNFNLKKNRKEKLKKLKKLKDI